MPTTVGDSPWSSGSRPAALKGTVTLSAPPMSVCFASHIWLSHSSRSLFEVITVGVCTRDRLVLDKARRLGAAAAPSSMAEGHSVVSADGHAGPVGVRAHLRRG